MGQCTQPRAERWNRGGSPAVLIVSHTSPPQANAGAARIASFARLLPDLGWRPVFVTSALAGAGSVGGAPTARVGEPLHAYWVRRGRARGDGLPVQAGEDDPSLAKRVLAGAAIPDPHVGWLPGAVRASIRMIRSHRVAAVLSSSPSEVSHLAALGAARMTGVPWVAEFRDGWLTESLRRLDERPVRRRIEAVLERAVATRAAALVGVTRPLAEDLHARFGSGVWLPNGFDELPPDAEAEAEAERLLTPDAVNLVYTGTFAGSRSERSPAVLVEAIRLVKARADLPAVRLTVMGALDAAERRMLAAANGTTLVEHGARSLALALQRKADGLVVVTAPGERVAATGKLFEYLGAGRPILALADGSEAAALVRELDAGLCVAPDDPHAAADAIAAIARGQAPRPDPADPRVAAFRRPEVAARLAGLLDEVSGRAAPR